MLKTISRVYKGLKNVDELMSCCCGTAAAAAVLRCCCHQRAITCFRHRLATAGAMLLPYCRAAVLS